MASPSGVHSNITQAHAHQAHAITHRLIIVGRHLEPAAYPSKMHTEIVAIAAFGGVGVGAKKSTGS